MEWLKDINKNWSLYLFAFLKRIVFVSELLAITNAYAMDGDNRAIVAFASFKSIARKIFPKIVVVSALVSALIHYAERNEVDLTKTDFASLNLDIFPNLVGFGIGVYALIFVLPKSFINFLEEKRKDFHFGPEILNADLAYPLIVLCGVLLFSLILKFFPYGPISLWLSVFMTFYGLAMVFELVGFIFITAQRILVPVASEKQQDLGD